jgi:1-phosphatidylinositol-3-phosphate 5-kinase
VAELVKKYQDFLPEQGVHDLAKTAFPPRVLVSESEQEYPAPVQRRHTVRSKSRHRLPKKASTSDFEQGYAANVAPRYLTRSRRALGSASQASRIPGPTGSAFESQESSRRPSPEKRSLSGKAKEVRFGRPSSPGAKATPTTSAVGGRTGKVKPGNRTSRDKPPASTGSKSNFRRPTTGPGSKVSSIAKHFERLGRDAERSRSRYSVIRGRRARPVASARAKVEVLDSVKDAIKDESESSDSSSEADDEGDGNDEGRTVAEMVQQSSPESDPPLPEMTVKTAPPLASFPTSSGDSTVPQDVLEASPLPPPGPASLPPSPFLTSVKMSHTTPPSDLDIGSSNSILKAISGLWLQPLPASRHPFDGDDPMNDPEHIFRDGSMVVRTDEPTSIIALALK